MGRSIGVDGGGSPSTRTWSPGTDGPARLAGPRLDGGRGGARQQAAYNARLLVRMRMPDGTERPVSHGLVKLRERNGATVVHREEILQLAEESINRR